MVGASLPLYWLNQMRPDGRLSDGEQQNESQQALVSSNISKGHATLNRFETEDDSKQRTDKITIMETFCLSLQHFMGAASRCVLAVLHISYALCLLPSDPIRGLLLARFLFLSGVTTLLQTSPIGIGLPLAHAPCLPTLVALSFAITFHNSETSLDHCPSTLLALDDMDVYQRSQILAPRLGQIQGALLITSLAGIVIAIAVRFTPFPRRPAIAALATIAGALIAIKPAADVVAITNWPTALFVITVATTIAVITIGKKRIPLPLPACSARKGFHFHCQPIAATSVFLTVMIVWIACAIGTATKLISESSPLSTSSSRPDRMVGPTSFLVPSVCWGTPSFELETSRVVVVGFLMGVLLNWSSWAAVAAATETHDVKGSVQGSWKGILVYGLSAALAGIVGAPAPMASGADTAGVAFFAKVAGSRAAGLIPLRVCGVLLILTSLVPSVSVVVCSTPIPALMGASLLFMVSSAGAGFLYFEKVNLRAFNPRLLIGLALLGTLTFFAYTFSGPDLKDKPT